MMTNPILKPGNVAVITGAAAGIGAAAAKHCAKAGMRLLLLDKDQIALERLASQLDTEYQLVVGDVTDKRALQQMHDTAFETFGQVNLLFNNAGIGRKTLPWDGLDNWRLTMEVNLFALVETQAIFVPSLLKQAVPSAIVNLGSKEGITTPPGNAAYSVSKAGVKVLTEQLAHELRQLPDHQVTAHLLVPGYTWTPMNFPNADFSKAETKPDAPWSPEELMTFFEDELNKGSFYMMALDNEVTKDVDAKRMTWAVNDIIQNRPALSRWHEDYKEKFAEFVKD